MGIETLAMVAAIGGTALSAAGSIQAGNAAKKAGDFNASVDQQRAASEQDAAAAEAQDVTRQGTSRLASGIAAQGASGVTPEGSPLMVDEATVREIALGAARKIQGGDVRAGRLQDDAKLETMKGKNAQTAGYIKAASTILTSFGKMGGGSGGGSGATAGGGE